MKFACLLIFTFLSFTAHKAYSQRNSMVQIEDSIFRQYLKKKIPEAFEGSLMNINSKSVKSLTRINVINKKIKSFNGIEYFTALEEFDCTYNLAEFLDLSKNKELRYLNCWENKLKGLNISKNKKLTFLNCGDNQITLLNTSENKNLQVLRCEYNNIKHLDLTNNRHLTVLNIANNQIGTLNIQKNQQIEYLETTENPIKQVTPNQFLAKIDDKVFLELLKKKIPNAFVGDYLNIKHNNVKYLKVLDIQQSNIKSLNGIAYFKSLETLNCQNTPLTHLNLSKNVHLKYLNIKNTKIKTLDIRGIRDIVNTSGISSLLDIEQIKIHENIRESKVFQHLKNQLHNQIIISVYGAQPGSSNYYLINSNFMGLKMN